jgi:hypothetical protein
MGGRQDFNRYVEKKILTRLGIFAMHNKEKNEESDMMFKGEFIFAGNEKDRRSAAAFLVLLLDCIEKWSRLMPLTEEAGKGPSQFIKTYKSLQEKSILFPSQCRQGNPLHEFGLNEEAGVPPKSRAKTEYKSKGPKMDTQKMAADLKDRMMKAKAAAKRSELFLAKFQKQNFEAFEVIEVD